MARKQRTVVEVQCDRCTRSEERTAEEADGSASLAFTGNMFGLAVRFEDLCTPCLRTVKNHLEQIGKKLEGMSPDRVAKSLDDEPALVAPISPMLPPGTTFGPPPSITSAAKVKTE